MKRHCIIPTAVVLALVVACSVPSSVISQALTPSNVAVGTPLAPNSLAQPFFVNEGAVLTNAAKLNISSMSQNDKFNSIFFFRKPQSKPSNMKWVTASKFFSTKRRDVIVAANETCVYTVQVSLNFTSHKYSQCAKEMQTATACGSLVTAKGTKSQKNQPYTALRQLCTSREGFVMKLHCDSAFRRTATGAQCKAACSCRARVPRWDACYRGYFWCRSRKVAKIDKRLDSRTRCRAVLKTCWNNCNVRFRTCAKDVILKGAVADLTQCNKQHLVCLARSNLEYRTIAGLNTTQRTPAATPKPKPPKAKDRTIAPTPFLVAPTAPPRPVPMVYDDNMSEEEIKRILQQLETQSLEKDEFKADTSNIARAGAAPAPVATPATK